LAVSELLGGHERAMLKRRAIHADRPSIARGARSPKPSPASAAVLSSITTSIPTRGSMVRSRPASCPPTMRSCFAGWVGRSSPATVLGPTAHRKGHGSACDQLQGLRPAKRSYSVARS